MGSARAGGPGGPWGSGSAHLAQVRLLHPAPSGSRPGVLGVGCSCPAPGAPAGRAAGAGAALVPVPVNELAVGN